MLYQIYDFTDDCLIANDFTFESAKEYIAEPWMEDNEEHYERILAAGSLEELDNYAAGLGYSVERVEQK